MMRAEGERGKRRRKKGGKTPVARIYSSSGEETIKVIAFSSQVRLREGEREVGHRLQVSGECSVTFSLSLTHSLAFM